MSAHFFSSRCEYRRRRACLNVDSTFEPRQTSVHACTATVVCTPGPARPGGRPLLGLARSWHSPHTSHALALAPPHGSLLGSLA